MGTDRTWMAYASSDYEQECGLILRSLKSQNFSQRKRALDQIAPLVKSTRYLKTNTNIEEEEALPNVFYEEVPRYQSQIYTTKRKSQTNTPH